jgi:hypothetical protein
MITNEFNYPLMYQLVKYSFGSFNVKEYSLFSSIILVDFISFLLGLIAFLYFLDILIKWSPFFYFFYWYDLLLCFFKLLI